jgi:hypothetical protein
MVIILFCQRLTHSGKTIDRSGNPATDLFDQRALSPAKNHLT